MTEKKTQGEKWIHIDQPGSFGWFVKYEFSEHWLAFTAYECIGEMCNPDAGKKLFRADKSCEHVGLDEIDKAEVGIDGFVKWDGCCEMKMGRPHFCGSEDVAQLALVMRELHKLCLLLPALDYACAGYPDPLDNAS